MSAHLERSKNSYRKSVIELNVRCLIDLSIRAFGKVVDLEPLIVTYKNDALKDDEPVLIVARPGRIRDSLKILLNLISRIRVIGQADDRLSALAMIKGYYPKLVLLDMSLPETQSLNLLRWIKTEHPQTQCIVFVDNIRQQQLARNAGASAVLLKGFAIAELWLTIEKSLVSLNK